MLTCWPANQPKQPAYGKCHTWPCLHHTSLLPHSLTVIGSSLLCLDPHSESEASCAVLPPATMPIDARTCPPSSSYSSCVLLLPAPRHPPTATAPLNQRASLMDPPASRRGKELRVMPPCRRVAHVVVVPASSALPQPPCTIANLRTGVELLNNEPLFVQVAR
jgi:hypothetical protein